MYFIYTILTYINITFLINFGIYLRSLNGIQVNSFSDFAFDIFWESLLLNCE